MHKDTILEAFNFRHACKDFDTSKTIDGEQFNTILEAGHLSPSSFGFEPWKFLVIQDPTMREHFTDFTWGGKKQIPNSSHFVVLLARKGSELNPGSDYIRHMMENVQQLPAEILTHKSTVYKKFVEQDFSLTTDALRFDWAKRQTYLALANMMTVAAMLEIDSCPMEGFDEHAVNETLAKECGVDISKFGVSVMVAFGYRVQQPRPKTRRDTSEVVQFL